MRKRGMLLVTLVLVAALAAGCANGKETRLMNAKLMQLAKAPPTEPEYRVAPPDRLSVEVRGYPEYTREVLVRPDGKITLPGTGDIEVQGLTVPEINKVVTDKLSAELTQPNVTITLVSAASKAVYVLGEVRRPGLYPYYGDMTAIDAIGAAGGFTFYAEPKKVRITREGLQSPPRDVLVLNFKALVLDGNAEQNVSLSEGDIVYVPPTPFAKVGYAVDQLLYPFRSVLGGLITYGQVDRAVNNNNN